MACPSPGRLSCRLPRYRLLGNVPTPQRLSYDITSLSGNILKEKLDDFGFLLIKKAPLQKQRGFFPIAGFSAYFIVGMTNSAPDLMPDGQREVIVLVFVQNLIESVPCWLRSPKLEAFQPPKE
jgi:hypothetical protein